MATLLIPLLMAAICSCDKPDPGLWVPPPSNDTEELTPEKPEEEEPVTPAPPQEGYIVVGYATYWETTMPDPSLLTHINYAFAHIKNDFESLDIKREDRLVKITELKKKNPDLKVLLSVGGWGAGNFSDRIYKTMG